MSLPKLLRDNTQRLGESYALVASMFKRWKIPYVCSTAGSFVFARLAVIGGESEEELTKALRERGVLIIAGKDFHLGEEERGWVRINYAVGIERLREGLRRIERHLVEKSQAVENDEAIDTCDNTEDEVVELSK